MFKDYSGSGDSPRNTGCETRLHPQWDSSPSYTWVHKMLCGQLICGTPQRQQVQDQTGDTGPPRQQYHQRCLKSTSITCYQRETLQHSPLQTGKYALFIECLLFTRCWRDGGLCAFRHKSLSEIRHWYQVRRSDVLIFIPKLFNEIKSRAWSCSTSPLTNHVFMELAWCTGVFMAAGGSFGNLQHTKDILSNYKFIRIFEKEPDRVWSSGVLKL